MALTEAREDTKSTKNHEEHEGGKIRKNIVFDELFNKAIGSAATAPGGKAVIGSRLGVKGICSPGCRASALLLKFIE